MNNNPIELLLHDRSKLCFTRLDSGALSVELYQAGHLRDGHGWLLQASTVLTLKEAAAFVQGITERRRAA